jgi:hypothetical protein
VVESDGGADVPGGDAAGRDAGLQPPPHVQHGPSPHHQRSHRSFQVRVSPQSVTPGSCFASQLHKGCVSPVSYARFVFRQSVTPGSCFASHLRQVRVSPVSYARVVFRQTILPSTVRVLPGVASRYLTRFVHSCTGQSAFCIFLGMFFLSICVTFRWKRIIVRHPVAQR